MILFLIICRLGVSVILVPANMFSLVDLLFNSSSGFPFYTLLEVNGFFLSAFLQSYVQTLVTR